MQSHIMWYNKNTNDTHGKVVVFLNKFNRRIFYNGEVMEEYVDLPDMMSNYVSTRAKLKRYKNLDNRLVFLKGFSSSIPLIKQAVVDLSELEGGGMYLSYNGYGIVIDPGINFLQSFHSYGFSLQNIKCVIVTHSHIDHCADLEKILALQYDYNKYVENQRFVNKYSKLDYVNIKIFCDKITYNKLQTEYKRSESLDLVKIEDTIDYKIEENLSVRFFKVQHDKKCKTYALKISAVGYKTFGYSSDTRYFSGLKDFLADAELEVLNISEINDEDLHLKKLKKTHLGFYGCYNLIKKENTDKRFFVSEFCCLKGDNRIDIIKSLREQSSNNNIYPSSIGLSVDLYSGNIECTLCGYSSNKSFVLSSGEYKPLMYACDKCVLE